jgi:hypothetical protein
LTPLLYPDYETRTSVESFVKEISGLLNKKNKSREDTNRLLSKGYFEARKAVEFRLSKVKKEK